LDAVGSLAAELGYDRLGGALFRAGDAEVEAHPFAPELRAIFAGRSSEIGGGADAVFCLDRVPTVCLVDQMSLDRNPDARRAEVRMLCERLWNQNLARVVLIASDTSIEAWSVDNPNLEPELVQRGTGTTSVWSFSGLSSGDVLRGRNKWFDAANRVDSKLLENISELVGLLVTAGLDPPLARRLIARVIFVTYLEDRGIIGDSYRLKRNVKPLIELVSEEDTSGLTLLFSKLREDFNGDFLNTADGERGWEAMPTLAFEALFEFLRNTTLRSGERSFWRYDFSQIPIELIASIYETFLSQKDTDDRRPGTNADAGSSKRRQGAYYTPRALADWVVDLALQDRDASRERIYDPACGSGMLLTAAYRRLIRTFERQAIQSAQPPIADFATRRRLLLEQIFGADIDEDACQLTSFSLYLALLADLSPADLEELRAGGHKLPSLSSNIRRGAVSGDFFSEVAATASNGVPTIVLSNPPWRTLTAGEPAEQAMKAWIQRQPVPRPRIPKNQIAAAFALGAADALPSGGRVALILPVGLMVSNDPAQRAFRAHLLGRYQIVQIVNFADMRRLIFADAAHPFAVLIAEARPIDARFPEIGGERFAYWTPKTDMSIALGRLAVHGADRAELPASALIDESPQLGLRYWGSELDAALLNKLRRHGRVRDLVGRFGWMGAKGFHAKDEDKRRKTGTWYQRVPDWMRDRPFLPAGKLPADTPLCWDWMLRACPFEQVARVPPQRLFEGPRVIWPDGTHPESGVKAVYSDKPFTFRHSLAVLSAPKTCEGTLIAKFLTAYLRSPLALWLQLLLSSSVASERPKLHIDEAMDWPFWPLDRHPNPKLALSIMERVGHIFSELPDPKYLILGSTPDRRQLELDQCVYQYFGLTVEEIRIIEELAEYAGPSLQPTSVNYKALARPIRRPPSEEQAQRYCQVLAGALTKWRDATGGEGHISASAWTGQTVPIGAAVLTLGTAANRRVADDTIAEELVAAYDRLARAPGDDLLTIPDLALVDGPRIFLIKPLIARFWLERSAIEDASRLALQLQAIGGKKAVA